MLSADGAHSPPRIYHKTRPLARVKDSPVNGEQRQGQVLGVVSTMVWYDVVKRGMAGMAGMAWHGVT